ncbi:hypothetical protein MMC22_010837 [Lobaria immixta]|nr:hypothetical protein [Lobaria immixta]
MDSSNTFSSNSSGLGWHGSTVYKIWTRLQSIVEARHFEIDGNLDMPRVVAVSRHGSLPAPQLGENVIAKMMSSIKVLESHLAKERYSNGANSGFGGNRDSGTIDLPAVKQALMQLSQTAVRINQDQDDHPTGIQGLDFHSMPLSWVKGTILVRSNTNARGHSAVSPATVEAMLGLLSHDIIPVVPLRGSISAPGDLMPLSYIAGAVEGNPDVWIRTGKQHGYKVVSAKEALESAKISPKILGPNEWLALINGTAASTAVASLALYEAHQLAILSQILTAMTAEALISNVENWHPFVADVHPHQGQTEVARNIRGFLAGSRLVRGATSKNQLDSGLYQDGYTLRSSSQWIGPQIEDLMHAHRQVTIELNSTSDNPVVDSIAQDVLACSNFQAISIMSAMEKTRLSLQMIGKLLFAETLEMTDPKLNNGLPPNLAADDPSLSSCMKGVDANMASYMSELAFLTAPVSAHVQSAEMHNQAVNSLAFITARYTTDAVELVSLMSAVQLYICCQALDLRVMHLEFLEEFQPVARRITTDSFRQAIPQTHLESIHTKLWKHITHEWAASASMDLQQRCQRTVESSVFVMAEGVRRTPFQIPVSMATLKAWSGRMLSEMRRGFESVRSRFWKCQSTVERLGYGSKALYRFVREELGVPFHAGLVEYPTANSDFGQAMHGREEKTVETWISILHESLRDGTLHARTMSMLGGVSHLEHRGLEHVNGGSNGDVYTNGTNHVKAYGVLSKEVGTHGSTYQRFKGQREGVQ